MGMSTHQVSDKIADIVYRNSPVVAQNAVVTLRGWLNRRARFGREFRRALGEITREQWRSEEEWEAYQVDKLLDILAEARRNVPFYADYPCISPGMSLRDTLRGLPIVEKDLVRERPSLFQSRRMSSLDTVAFRTSGTTGAPLKMIHTFTSHSIGWASMERLWRAAGVRYGDRRVSFTGNMVVPRLSSSGPYGRHDRANARMLMSVYHLGSKTVDAYLEEISDFRPDFMDGYPSAMVVCAKRLLERGETIPMTACFPTAEMLSDDDRTTIERAFQTRVYNQYGSAEGLAMIAECPAGSLHIYPEVGIAEVIRSDGTWADNGEEGELVLTTLNNIAMPLIRYRIGDFAVVADVSEPCPCGRSMPRVKRLIGRQDDTVVTRDGRRIGLLNFNVFKLATGIAASQIVQESVDRFVVRIVRAEGFTDKVTEGVVIALKARVGADVSVAVEYCDEIPRSSNGKIRAVISKVTPRGNGE